jgi:NADPH:quinone reductase-like Zn-dependent oxidoreductase
MIIGAAGNVGVYAVQVAAAADIDSFHVADDRANICW